MGQSCWKVVVNAFKFHHEDISVFVKSAWQRTSKPSLNLLVYKVVVTTCLMTICVATIVQPHFPQKKPAFYVKWLVYVTNWGVLIYTIQSALGTSMLVAYFRRCRRQDSGQNLDECPVGGFVSKVYKVYWALNIMSVDVSFAISFLYWVIIYRYENEADFDPLNFFTHIISCLAMFSDLAIASHPVDLMHFYLPLIFGVSYALFTYIYYLCNGTGRVGEPQIYPILNWRLTVRTTLLVIAFITSALLFHFCSYVLYLAREKIKKKIMGEKGGNLVEQPVNQNPPPDTRTKVAPQVNENPRKEDDGAGA